MKKERIKEPYWKKCEWEISFNVLGGLIMNCKTHSRIKGKYLRKVCCNNLDYKLKKIMSINPELFEKIRREILK